MPNVINKHFADSIARARRKLAAIEVALNDLERRSNENPRDDAYAREADVVTADLEQVVEFLSL